MKTHKLKKSKNRDLYEFLIQLGVPTTRISKYAEQNGEKFSPSMIWKYKKDVLENRDDESLNPIEFLNKLIFKYIDENSKIKLNIYDEKTLLYLLMLHRLGKNIKNEENCGVPLPTTDKIVEIADKILTSLNEIDTTKTQTDLDKVDKILKLIKKIKIKR